MTHTIDGLTVKFDGMWEGFDDVPAAFQWTITDAFYLSPHFGSNGEIVRGVTFTTYSDGIEDIRAGVNRMIEIR